MSLGGLPEAWIEPRRIWVGVQLAALSCHLPLSFVASNWRANASIPSIIAVTVVVFLASLTLYWVLARFTPTRWHALAMTSVAILLFWHWVDFQLQPGFAGGVPPILLQLVVIALVVAASWRFANRRYFKIGVFATSLTLAVVPAFLLIGLVVGSGDSNIERSDYTGSGATASRDPLPDIYFLVLDGYARADVLADDYGFDNTPFIEDLEAQGFFTSSRSTANYSSTHLSIPSMLDMAFPLREGPILSVEDLRELGDVTSGNNASVRALKNLGYFYVHGTSAWWGNRCGPAADHCLGGPLMDITAFDLLQATPLRPLLFPESGDPGTAITLRRLHELEAWDEVSAEWPDQPKFVFMHVILPHPPLYLDASCEAAPSEVLSQRRINAYPPLEPSVVGLRKDAYVEQVRCANLFVDTLLEAAGPDSIVIVSADHGPDSRSQLSYPVEVWSPEATLERFSTFTSMRLPGDCPGADDDLDLVNIFRLVLGCIVEDPGLPLLDPEYYATPPSRYEGSMTQIEDPDGFINGE